MFKAAFAVRGNLPHEKIAKRYREKRTESLDEDGIPLMKLLKQVRKLKMNKISDDRSFRQCIPFQEEMIFQTRISVTKRRIPSNQRTQEKPEKMLIVEVHVSPLEHLFCKHEVSDIRRALPVYDNGMIVLFLFRSVPYFSNRL